MVVAVLAVGIQYPGFLQNKIPGTFHTSTTVFQVTSLEEQLYLVIQGVMDARMGYLGG